MNRPSGILIDFGETLVGDLKYDPLAGHLRLLELAKGSQDIRPEDLHQAIRSLDEEIKPLRDSSLLEFPFLKYQQLLYARLNLSFHLPLTMVELEFWKASMSYSPEPGVLEALATLVPYGLKMGVVSNSPFSGSVLAWELQRHNLLKGIDFVLSSADCGLQKPHRLLFSLGAWQLGRAPSEVWFIGDTLDYDVLGSLQAGLWTIWYNRFGSQGGGVVPHAEAGNWEEITALVQRYLK